MGEFFDSDQDKLKGFLKIKRKPAEHRPIEERIRDFKEVPILRPDEESQEQGARCMDCGTPFCHFGCPISNYIPDWNDLVFKGKWQRAIDSLHATNDFPEFTGRLCPALCESACVLGLNDDPVTIRENELAIIEHAFRKGYIKPQPPKKRTGKRAAVVGSGPAGMACANQLNKFGHSVALFEKDDKIGGILRYGVPDFKLEKWIIDRRVDIMKKEGVQFQTNTFVGSPSPLPSPQRGEGWVRDYSAKKLKREFDAIALTGGSRVPRDLPVEGRELAGIHFAMDYLIQSNRRVAGEALPPEKLIDAKGKRVVVIGGGDTGADCVGVAHRQGADRVTQIELMPRPPECRGEDMPWPKHPMILKTTTSHEEGGERRWSILTKRFGGKGGKVTKIHCVELEFGQKDERGCPIMKERSASGFEIAADLVILAMGFTQPVHDGLLDDLGVAYDQRGNVKTDPAYATSVRGVFSAGDMHRGPSLVVWAICEGREAARSIDKFLSK